MFVALMVFSVIQSLVLCSILAVWGFKTIQGFQWAKQAQAESEAATSLLGSFIQAIPAAIALIQQKDLIRSVGNDTCKMSNDIEKLRTEMSKQQSEWTEVFRKSHEDLRSQLLNAMKELSMLRSANNLK